MTGVATLVTIDSQIAPERQVHGKEHRGVANCAAEYPNLLGGLLVTIDAAGGSEVCKTWMLVFQRDRARRIAPSKYLHRPSELRRRGDVI